MNSGCIIEAVDGSLNIGNRVSFNYNVTIIANQGEITLGDNVIVGMGTVIRAANHTFADTPNTPIRDQPHETGTVVIEDDVWIGANVTILPNVRIGRHSVLAAGAVINRDVPPCSVAAGVPAKIVGRTDEGHGGRKNEETKS